MHLLTGVCHMANHLILQFRSVRVGKFSGRTIPFLYLHGIIIEATTVDSWWCTGFHPTVFKTNFDQLFGDPGSCLFPGTASSKLLFSDMDDPIEEGAIGKDYGFCRYLQPQSGSYASDAAVFQDQPVDHFLPEIDIGMCFQHGPPFCSKGHPVALSAWTPHRRSFGAVQHTELDHGPVRDDSGIPAQRIHLTYDLTFGDPAHSRIAGHLGNGLHVHGYQQDFRSHIGSSNRRFTASMACAYYDYIIFDKHDRVLLGCKNSVFQSMLSLPISYSAISIKSP